MLVVIYSYYLTAMLFKNSELKLPFITKVRIMQANVFGVTDDSNHACFTGNPLD